MSLLSSLQQSMVRRRIAATIIPSTDPHGSEYVASHWQARRAISGFDGSAGTLVVTDAKAALWTDSRYFIQAAEQLADTGIELMKEGLADTPAIEQWLMAEISAGDVISLDAKLFSIGEFERWQSLFASKNVTVAADIDLVSEVWTSRPPIPQNPIRLFSKAGRDVSQKVDALRTATRNIGAEAFVLTALDEIAWLFNIRGNDIEFNPVAVSYAYVATDRIILFIDSRKCDEKARRYFAQNGIETVEYDRFFDFLTTIANTTIAIDFRRANYKVFSALHQRNKLKDVTSPIIEAKAVKNSVELAGFRRAMIKDGVALVRFCMWLQYAVKEGIATELRTSQKLHECRGEQEGFVSESFETIAAYQAHGAIVHYAPTPQSDLKLAPHGLLLLDSGGQYADGTTDITRTIPLGRLTSEQRHYFTLVLKGLIALSKAVFPQGTRGVQLDVLARQYLWQHSKNFGHGTGHGVGHHLCVHEGPQSIRMQENPQPLIEGMVTSNEPAVYLQGKYGIRHENLIAVRRHKKSNAFGQFYEFETLTLFPFDRRGLELSLMTKDEIDWLNKYHTTCYKKLSPYLNTKEKTWLKRMTAAI